MASNSEKQSCGHCNKITNSRATNIIICDGNCKKCFHIKCAKLGVQEYSEIVNSDDKFWFCKTCKSARTKQRQSLSLLTLTTPITSLTNTPTSDNPPEMRIENNEHTLATLNAKMDKILESNNILKREINHLKIIVEDYKKITDEIIQSNTYLQNENEKLKWKIINVQYNIDTQEQQKLENNIIVSGIEQKDGENTNEIIIEMAKSLNINISNDDIENSQRSNKIENNSGLPPEIMVKFKNSDIKVKIMINKKSKKLNTNMFDINKIDVTHRAFYINEQLVKTRQFIYKKARDARKNDQIKYAWVRNGEIYVRKTDTSKIIKLKDISQLDAI